MDPEICAFTQIWLAAVISLVFCHQIAARIPAGSARLLSLLPVIYLFAVSPVRLSYIHLIGPTFFYLVWLGNFKLLLFSFNQGPLSTNPPLSLLHFIPIALLPVNFTKKPPSANHEKTSIPIFIFLLKCGLLAGIVGLYSFMDFIHPYLLVSLLCCHTYLAVELILAVSAEPVRAVLGMELEPQFDEPYLSTSLQDFWGRRWNLMATGILRPTVYVPVRRVVGGKWARPAATIATFVVSGLMHEVLFFYLTRVAPTWEVTCFFVLHGFCVAAEVGVKKALGGGGQGRLWRVVSRPLTVGFVAATAGWLFFPQVIRNGAVKNAIDEYWILLGFVRENLRLFFDFFLAKKNI